MRRLGVAGGAGDPLDRVRLEEGPLVVGRREPVIAPRDHVLLGGVAAGAVEILVLHGHVDVERLVGLEHGGVEIPVFDPLPSSTEEVAGPAVLSGGEPHALRDLVPLGGKIGLLLCGEGGGLRYRVAGHGGELLVGAGLLVADETIHLGLVGKVETLVLEPIADMAGGAAGLVGGHGHTEVVHHESCLSKLPFRIIRCDPAPVKRLLDLLARLGVAAEAGFRHLRTALELLFEGLEFRVVRRHVLGVVGPIFAFAGALFHIGRNRPPAARHPKRKRGRKRQRP